MARGVLGIASAIAGVTLLSKGVGFGRELLVAAIFGASVAKDAYTIAYIIPAFSLVMLGGLTGPFHTTAQKILTTLRQRGQDAEVATVMLSVFAVVSAVMGALALATYFGASTLVHLLPAGASPTVLDLAARQLQIMSPMILLGGWIGILCGISNDQGDYALPSLSPLVASLAVVVAIVLVPDPISLAWGTTAGAVGQVLLQGPAAWRLFTGNTLGLDLGHPEVRGLWRVLLPASIGSSIGTLSVIIGTYYAAMLPAGAISVFDYANKLIQLPLGILMTALLIPVFPLLTAAAVAGDRPKLFHWINQGLRTIALATLPLVALFVAVGEPLVAVLYQRGAFDAVATHQTYGVLIFTSLGILTYAVRDLFVRVFYALDDGRTPLLVSLAALAVTAISMGLLVGPFGLFGLAGAAAGVTAFNCLVVVILLRRKLGELPISTFWPVLGKATVAAALAGLVAWGLAYWLPNWAEFWGALGHLVARGSLLAVVYVALLAAFGLPVAPAIKAIAVRLLGGRFAMGRR